MDFRPGMSSQKPPDPNGKPRHSLLHRLSDHGDIHFHPGPAGTAGYENAFLLLIQIDHTASTQHGEINYRGALHPRLLIHCHNHFQTGQRKILRIQKRQTVSHTDSVITSQACPLGIDLPVLDLQIKRLLLHIDPAARRGHCHHIHVGLQDIRRLFLICRRRLSDNNNVSHRILHAKQLPFFSEGFQIITDLTHIAGTMRYPADLLKKMKYALRFQSVQCSHKDLL